MKNEKLTQHVILSPPKARRRIPNVLAKSRGFFASLRMTNQFGQTLIELLLAISISVMIIPVLTLGIYTSRQGRVAQKQRIEAIALLKEEEEAVRNVREKGWSTFAINGTYHATQSASVWTLLSGPETVNGFTRQLAISDVSRDASGAISQTGGTVDTSTKKVTLSVLWTQPLVSSIDSTIYLTRYLDNASYTQTTESDFNTGTKTGAAVTNTNGGEVILGAGGKGNWCSPATPSANMVLNLPKQGVANAVSAIEGRAFAGTGDNASGESFININIANISPPSASILGTLSNFKTNDVFGETNFGYIATDETHREIVIIDISSTPYNEIGSFDAPTSVDADSVFILGNTGYMTQGNKFRNFDVTSKTGSRPAIDSDGVTLAGTGTKTFVVGSFAYVSIAGSSTKMQIIDLSNPSNLTMAGQTVINSGDARGIFVNSTGTRAYLATDESPTQPEFFIINTENKSSPSLISSYEANGMSPKGVTGVTGNKAILVGISGEEYQVVDISNEGSPSRCGGLQIDKGINAISSVLETDGDAYSYILTKDDDKEFQIIEGGPGGQFSSSGTFESSAFDPGYQTAFNRFSATVSKPFGTDIKLQMALAEAVSGSCQSASFTYLGPNGDPDQFFTTGTDPGIISAAIPIVVSGDYKNPGRCFRYKAFLSTTDLTKTPTLYDMTVNYSP